TTALFPAAPPPCRHPHHRPAATRTTLLPHPRNRQKVRTVSLQVLSIPPAPSPTRLSPAPHGLPRRNDSTRRPTIPPSCNLQPFTAVCPTSSFHPHYPLPPDHRGQRTANLRRRQSLPAPYPW